MDTRSTFDTGALGLARLAGDLQSRQAALDRFLIDGRGGFQARKIAGSMRDMVRAIKVGVAFGAGSRTLQSDYLKDLIPLADALRNLSAVCIDIEAHGDPCVSRRRSRNLAFDRARAVRGVFLRRGVSMHRITARAVAGPRVNQSCVDDMAARETLVRFDIVEVKA